MKPSVATVKGHLNQQRQRHRKPLHVTPTPIPTRTHTIYAATLDPTQPTGNSFSDLTGRFPIQSNRGANYIFVLYDYDSNAILVRPLRNRSAHEIHRVFTSVHTYLVTRGLRPRLHTLDNEASTILKEFLTAENVEYQLVPPHIHRRNSAERAIQTFKYHFIAGLASTDPNFPLSNWCRLLPQTELTLNLLRPSRLNPKLSAYAQLEGAFDFNRTPLAPPGTIFPLALSILNFLIKIPACPHRCISSQVGSIILFLDLKKCENFSCTLVPSTMIRQFGFGGSGILFAFLTDNMSR